jgi:hypothetical protein
LRRSACTCFVENPSACSHLNDRKAPGLFSCFWFFLPNLQIRAFDRRGAMRTSRCANITTSISLYFPSTLEASAPVHLKAAGIEFIDENGGGPGV